MDTNKSNPLLIAEIIKALEDESGNPNHALMLVIAALEERDMPREERSHLLRIYDIILERLITRDGRYKVVPVFDDSTYDAGYFVSSLDYLTRPYTIHEHYYIQDGDTKLTEWYYTGANGLKYRQVIIPEEYKDPGFLLDNSMIGIRTENMIKLANRRKNKAVAE